MRHNIFLFALFLILLSSLTAQSNIDSLKVLFKDMSIDHEIRLKESEKIYEHYWKHPDSMLIWANHRYDLSLKMNDPYLEAKSLYEISHSLFQLGLYDESVLPALKADYILQAFPDDDLKFEILYRLAEGYEYTDCQELGMQKYSECYKLAEKLNLNQKLISLDLKLGNIYKVNNFIQQAEEYYSSALSRTDKQENLFSYISTAGNVYNLKIGYKNLFSSHDLEQSCDSVVAFYKIIKADKKFERLEPFYFKLFVDCIKSTDRKQEIANIHLPTLEQIQQKYSNRNHLISFLSGYFEIAILRKDFMRSQIYVDGLYELADGENDLGFRKNALMSDRVLKTELKDYKSLVFILEELQEIDLRLNGEDRMSSISNLEETFRKKEEAYKIELLEKEKDILLAQSQKRLLYIIGISLISLLGLGFFWNAKRKNKIIGLRNNELNKVNNVKDQLFAIIGHDLRKPAISFKGISKKMRYLIDQKDYATLEKFSLQIEDNVSSLNKITDNLLNWALLQRDVMPYNPKKVSLTDIAKDMNVVFSSALEEKGLQFINNVPEGSKVFSDFNSLITIFTNLIDNAVKYTPEGGQISLDTKTLDNFLRIKISDSGIGMDQNQIENIFLLKKDKNTKGTSGEQGTGLGLHLVNELVQINKGHITVISHLGSGTTFELDLPV